MTFDAIPSLILIAVAIYGAVGIVFAAFFVARGGAAIDPILTKTPLRTRILFAPGAVALWPVLLLHWKRSEANA